MGIGPAHSVWKTDIIPVDHCGVREPRVELDLTESESVVRAGTPFPIGLYWYYYNTLYCVAQARFELAGYEPDEMTELLYCAL